MARPRQSFALPLKYSEPLMIPPKCVGIGVPTPDKVEVSGYTLVEPHPFDSAPEKANFTARPIVPGWASCAGFSQHSHASEWEAWGRPAARPGRIALAQTSRTCGTKTWPGRGADVAFGFGANAA